ncbi:MAG: fused response regulator/phosphatase [Verrucomicrobiota bacterium]
MSEIDTQGLAEKPRRILLVDNEACSLEYLKACLKKVDCAYDTACNNREAKDIISRASASSFHCIITNCDIAEENTIELIEWIKNVDETLSTVIIADPREKEFGTDTLRKGASDYLEKPVPPKLIAEVVNRLCNLTKQQRSFRVSHFAVSELANLQSNFCQSKKIPGTKGLDLFYLPKHELGGDFLDIVPISPTCYAITCADVSGHDLKAAYISSYFQGMARGMLQKGAALHEVIESINHILLKEWNSLETSQKGCVNFSLAAAFTLIDTETGSAEIYNCGFPAPILVDKDGVTYFWEDGSQPLGWFEEGIFSHSSYLLKDINYIIMHTDGHSDLADSLDIHPMSLAYWLLNLETKQEHYEITSLATDDILLANVNLNKNEEGFFPIFQQKLTQLDIPRIDTVQSEWERSLIFALPQEEIEPRMNDILLCCREITLNALKHGCTDAEGSFCDVTFSYQKASNILSAWIDDHGPGFEFNKQEVLAEMGTMLIQKSHISLGLITVSGLSDDIQNIRNGSCTRMNFKLGHTNL